MPYKHNESCRHKIEKARYKVTNWTEYNNGLRRRGDITIPDFNSITKRSINLPKHILTKAMEPGSFVIVGSTGLKVYGKDEWHQEKHGVPARRTWRKLHLAINENHHILACELTTPEVGDPTVVPDLLTQIDTPFETFMGDGAYDGAPVSEAVLNKQPNAQVVVPPHKNAVCSDACDTQRDQHIQAISEQGRIAWQHKMSYNLRNYVELAMQRYKRIFGNAMKARALPQQKTEAWISASALNRMTNLGMPVSIKSSACKKWGALAHFLIYSTKPQTIQLF